MKILLTLLFVFNVLLQASIGIVSFVKGEGYVLRDTKNINIKVGLELLKNDIIKTKDNTKVKITFNDKTLITVGKNSQFSIESYFYDEKKPQEVKAVFRFTKGLFRTVSGRIGKLNKDKFKIRVHSSSIGIRGTKFDVYVEGLVVKIGVINGAVYYKRQTQIVDIKLNEFFVYNINNSTFKIKKGALIESEEFKKYDIFLDEEIEINKIIEDKKETEDNNEDDSTDENKEETADDIVIVPIENDNEVETETPKFVFPNKDNILSDTNLKQEAIDNIDDLDYGYWQDTNQNNLRVDTFVQGTLTPDVVIEDYIGQANNTATYNGGISSIITNTDGSKISSDGTIVLNIDFSNESFDGIININEGNWKANINSGTVNSSSFSSNDISSSADSSVSGISGDVGGNYYGTQAQSVGGEFNLNSTSNGTVKGAFGGTK